MPEYDNLDQYFRDVNSPLFSRKELLDALSVDVLVDRGVLTGTQVLASTLTNAEVRNAYRAYNSVVSATVGDGDTIDIQTAIDAINDTNQGGIVLVRPGTYKPDAPITMYSNISVVGVDPTNTIIDFENAGDLTNGGIQIIGTQVSSFGSSGTATNADATFSDAGATFQSDGVVAGNLIIINGVKYEVSSVTSETALELTTTYKGNTDTSALYEIWSQKENIRIANLTIKDGADASTAGVGINMQYADNIDVQNCFIANNTTGINIQVTNDVRVQDCISFDNTANGITVANCYATYLTSCVASNNGAVGIQNGGIRTGNLFITNCNASLNDTYGIHMLLGNNTIIRGCSIIGNDIHGVYMTGGTYNIVQGCFIDKNGTDGVHMTAQVAVDSEYNSVLGNIITNCGDDGVELTATGNNSNVCHNIFSGNSGTDVVNGGTGNTVADNT